MTQLSSLKLTVEHTQLEKQHWEERWRSAQVPPLPPPPLPLALLACSYSVFVAFLWLVLSLLCFPRPPPLPNFLISLFCACSSTFPPPDRPCFAFFWYCDGWTFHTNHKCSSWKERETVREDRGKNLIWNILIWQEQGRCPQMKQFASDCLSLSVSFYDCLHG